MQTPQLDPKCRLHGVSVLLSASIPTPERRDEYARIFEAPIRIEEAIVCIARAIFIEGGTLVFGGHPSISPLIARVIEHYYLPAPAEDIQGRKDHREREIQWNNPSLVIYQSQVWKKHWADSTKRLARHPLVFVKWTRAKRGETVDPDVRDRPQAPMSMEKMRKSMIVETSPVAVIAIGGMKGVLDESRLFAELRPGMVIYTLATTGGAAAILPGQQGYANIVRVMDLQAESLVRQFWEEQESLKARERFAKEEGWDYYIPYAFIAQQIVAELVENHGRRP
jgi:hypothetical protein